MLILSIDSAGSNCNVCVWRDGKTLAEAAEHMERGQDQRLMPLILETMKKANVTFDVLDRIAVTRGPGSFTGLRIGLAAARGIGLASGKPVIGIDRFSIYREQIKDADKNILVVINSKRTDLFCRFYPVGGEPIDLPMMTPDEIWAFLETKPNSILTGDLTFTDVIAFFPVTEKEVITSASLTARADTNDPKFLPRPLYLRAPDVTMKRQAEPPKEQCVG